jgi:putative ABC transport system ATP-binding protein
MSILTLNNVCYKYAGARKEVLKDITIDFEEGKVYTIVGKSGAGKSTILFLLAGLDCPTGGSIIYHQKDMKELDRDEYHAKNIGVIFQDYNLLTTATAIDNVILSMDISEYRKKNKKEYAYQILQKVGIDNETANRKVLKLSGGEQQRIGIACAISHKPNIIIADEPTGNLDKETEQNIMEILTSLAHEEKRCVIVVTHSRSVAAYADELWGLNQGRLTFIK